MQKKQKNIKAMYLTCAKKAKTYIEKSCMHNLSNNKVMYVL